MKVLDKKSGKTDNITYDPKLDNLPVPKIVLEKTERARKFLEKHPIPEQMLRK
ncbi:hypothetical protein [Dyadobacter pollutisoli]|uniref:Uncharacterized protein n=1 Tax=Dyadobacter pollutisoli TaxID=2910158 RepID=A0A9E8NAY0_9BACT|nr:hypothetical protein [Dyadobacter pollutisoli]WAC11983.1 hypothetical protein ON006_30170 [Dyadobacter pollutisoli]